jgi:hypothetical protein
LEKTSECVFQNFSEFEQEKLRKTYSRVFIQAKMGVEKKHGGLEEKNSLQHLIIHLGKYD